MTNKELDDDMFDAALDAAELELKDKESSPEPEIEEPAGEPAPTEDTPEVEDEPASPAKASPKEAAPKDLGTKAEDTQTDANPEPQTQDAPQVEDPPFWSSQEKQLLAKVPAEIRGELSKIIAKKEAQRNEWANKVTAESEPARAFAKKLHETVTPFQSELMEQGVKDLPGTIDMMGNMLQWNRIFKTEPRTAITALMQQAGLSPQDLLGEAAQDTPAHYSDPRVEQAIADAQEAKRLAGEYRQQLERQQSQSMESEIAQFRNGVDSQGNSRAQFAQLYAPQISNVYGDIVARNPGMPLTEALDQAYETVLSQARAAHGVRTPTTAPTGKAPAQAKKAQAAASSVHGAPVSGQGASRKKNINLDEALDFAFEKHGL